MRWDQFELRCLVTFTFLFYCGGDQAASGGGLELVQIVFRHGDRTPYFTFPKDPYVNHWIEGLGQLTNLGKLQQYELGAYVRQRYASFLNDTYSCDQVVVRSTDVDRTLMSAQSHLAGLFPPRGNQVWDTKLIWQPIPVHTVPQQNDLLLNANRNNCPRFAKSWDEALNLPEVKSFIQSNKDLFELLTKMTGVKVNNTLTAGQIFDTLFIERKYNLTLPTWATEIFDQLQSVEEFNFLLDTYTVELKRLIGGPVLGDMLGNIRDKIGGKTAARQLVIYSAHDTNVAALLSALGLYNGILPPYACVVFVELHKTSTADSYGVQLYFRNTTDGSEPHELIIPNCTSPCPLDRFVSLTAPVVPQDIAVECKASGQSIVSIYSKLPWTVVAVVTVVLSVLFVAVLLFGVAFWRRKNPGGGGGYGYSIVQGE